MFTHGTLPSRVAWMRSLSVCLALALVAPPVTTLLPAAQAQAPAPALTPAAVKSILLFPASGTGDAAALGPRLDDAIQTRLSMVGTYSVTLYTKFLTAVQRGVTDAESGNGGLTQSDIRSPFGLADSARAQRIAALVGTDAYLLTSIASYSQDAGTRRVTLLVNSRVYDSKTGAALPGLGGTFSGTAAPTGAADTDADIQQGAINDVASRLTSSLNAAAPHAAPTVVASSRRGSSRAAQYTIGAILLVAAAVAIISGSHFGGGGGGSSSNGTNAASTSGGTTTGPPAPPSVR